MVQSSFSVRELTALTALADAGGEAVARQLESKTGLSALAIGQIFRHNETYVKIVGRISQYTTEYGHMVNLYALTNEGWSIIIRKRGNNHVGHI